MSPISVVDKVPPKVAFLGPEGTYTHQAAFNRFGTGVEYVAKESIAGMFLDSPLPPNKDAETVAQAMVVLLNIFDDLVCQNLPRTPIWPQSRETIDDLVEGGVVPNVSLGIHEVEQFENDALEYVRLDLSFASASSAAIADSPTAEGTTLRQTAADVLRVLVANGYAAVTTDIVLR
ncbi:hypothetical protein ACEPAG_3620 [Sanghuangporus baumii]